MRINANVTIDKNTFGKLTKGFNKGVRSLRKDFVVMAKSVEGYQKTIHRLTERYQRAILKSIEGYQKAFARNVEKYQKAILKAVERAGTVETGGGRRPRKKERAEDIMEEPRSLLFGRFGGGGFGGVYLGYQIGNVFTEFGERTGVVMRGLENMQDSAIEVFQRTQILTRNVITNYDKLVRRLSQLTGSVSEAMNVITETLQVLGVNAEKYLSSDLAEFAERAGLSVSELGGVVGSLNVRFGDMDKSIGYAKRALGILIKATGDAKKSFDLLSGSLNTVESVLKYMTEEEQKLYYTFLAQIQKSPQLMAKLGDKVYDYVLALTLGEETMRRIFSNFAALPESVRRNLVEIRGFEVSFESQIEKWGELRVSIGEVGADIGNELTKLLEIAKEEAKKIKPEEAFNALRDSLNKTYAAAEKTRRGVEEYSKLGTQIVLNRDLAKTQLEVARAIEQMNLRYLQLLQTNEMVRNFITTLLTLKEKALTVFNAMGIGLEELIAVWFGGKLIGGLFRGVGRLFGLLGRFLFKRGQAVGKMAAGGLIGGFRGGIAILGKLGLLTSAIWAGVQAIDSIIKKEDVKEIMANIISGLTFGLFSKETIVKVFEFLKGVLTAEKIAKIAKELLFRFLFAPFKMISAAFTFLHELIKGREFKEALAGFLDEVTFQIFGRENMKRMLDFAKEAFKGMVNLAKEILKGLIQELNLEFEKFSIGITSFLLSVMKGLGLDKFALTRGFIQSVESKLVDRVLNILESVSELKGIDLKGYRSVIEEMVKMGETPTSLEELKYSLDLLLKAKGQVSEESLEKKLQKAIEKATQPKEVERKTGAEKKPEKQKILGGLFDFDKVPSSVTIEPNFGSKFDKVVSLLEESNKIQGKIFEAVSKINVEALQAKLLETLNKVNLAGFAEDLSKTQAKFLEVVEQINLTAWQEKIVEVLDKSFVRHDILMNELYSRLNFGDRLVVLLEEVSKMLAETTKFEFQAKILEEATRRIIEALDVVGWQGKIVEVFEWAFMKQEALMLEFQNKLGFLDKLVEVVKNLQISTVDFNLMIFAEDLKKMIAVQEVLIAKIQELIDSQAKMLVIWANGKMWQYRVRVDLPEFKVGEFYDGFSAVLNDLMGIEKLVKMPAGFSYDKLIEGGFGRKVEFLSEAPKFEPNWFRREAFEGKIVVNAVIDKEALRMLANRENVIKVETTIEGKSSLDLIVENLVSMNKKLDELNANVQTFAQRGGVILKVVG